MPEMTKKARAQGLKYLETRRAAKASDMSASATMLARAWTDLERRGEVYGEAIDWDALFASLTEIVYEEIVEEIPATDESPVEEVVEEIVEEIAEEVVEEIPAAEAVVEETAEEIVEEVLVDPISQ